MPLNVDKLSTGSLVVNGTEITPGGGGLPYKVYTAKIPMGQLSSVVVYENTLGVEITWSDSAPGEITSGIIIGLIGQNNVYVQVSSSASSGFPKIVSGSFTPSPWDVRIKQTDTAGNPDNTQSVFVEIRVYN